MLTTLDADGGGEEAHPDREEADSGVQTTPVRSIQMRRTELEKAEGHR